MSVQVNQIIMYGIMLPKGLINDDNYEYFEDFMSISAYKKEVNHKDGLVLISDNYSGAYTLVGHVIDKSVDGETLDGPIVIHGLMSSKKRKFIKESIIRNFGEYLDLSKFKPDYIYLSHYS